MSDSLVRVFDPTTRAITTIPARELSSDMLATNVEGIEGMVYVHIDHMEAGPILHETLPLPLVERIAAIAAALAEVYPQSEEEWIDGFRRETDPEEEVQLWERITAKYDKLTERVTDVDQRTDIFHVLAHCAINPPEIAALVADCPTLGESGIQSVIDEWARP